MIAAKAISYKTGHYVIGHFVILAWQMIAFKNFISYKTCHFFIGRSVNNSKNQLLFVFVEYEPNLAPWPELCFVTFLIETKCSVRLPISCPTHICKNLNFMIKFRRDWGLSKIDSTVTVKCTRYITKVDFENCS